MSQDKRELQDVIDGVAKKRLTRRDVLKYAAVGGALASAGPLVSACGGDDTTTTASPSTGTPKSGGDLRIGIVGGSSKEGLDGQTVTTEPEICFCFQLNNSLLTWDEDYQIQPQLAEEYSTNADATVWTVKLRGDATFHDGKAVTADDVVFSFQRIVDPKDPKQGAAGISMLPMSGIRKVDAGTVEFHLDKPNSVFGESLAAYSNCILPVGFDPAAPIGAGPFKLETFKPGTQADFLPHTEYFGEAPHVDRLSIIEFADATARVNALLGGSVDAISQLPATQMAVVEGAGQKVLNASTGAWQPFTMRIDRKPFDDARVRQAFRLIVDRQGMITQAYGGVGTVGNDMYAPFDPGTPDLPQRVQDLEQAKSLLKQAGYDGDLTVTLTTSDVVGSAAVAAAQVFAEQAKGAGVTVKVNKVDGGVFYGDQYLQWDFAQDFWYTRNYLNQTTSGTTPDAPYNETHWKNDAWLALVEEAFRTGDEAARNELIKQAQTIEYNEGGLIIWAFNNQVDAYSSALGGVVPDKSGVPLSSFHLHKFYFV